MIGYLEGKITHLMADSCFINVGGVGYRVYIAAATRSRLVVNETAMLFTYLNVREDALVLYGFYSKNEYDVFMQLISVSGIGPKVALGMMSAITAENLCRAICEKNTALLVKLPGIGKKSAERLVLELHDKLGFADDEPLEALITEPQAKSGDIIEETTLALLSLGYAQAEFMPYLKKLGKVKSSEEAIKKILQEFARRQAYDR